MAESLPSFDELPIKAGSPPGSSWRVWGDEDFLGCLNLLTPHKVTRAARLINKGAVFSLNLELELPSPPLFGRRALEHQVQAKTPNVSDDEITGWNTQVSSQWDGFRHITHPTYGSYGGLDDERHGIHHWARRGIAGRAILADVVRWRRAEGKALRVGESDPIEVADIVATLRSENVEAEPGDILLVRTGFIAWYRSLDEESRRALTDQPRWPGLRSGRATMAFLWNLHIAAVAADNPSLEVWPPGALMSPDEISKAQQDQDGLPEIFLHFGLLPLLGLPIGELWDLDALAEDCAADGVYECFLASAPLNLSGGIASPPNALAIK